MIKVSLVFDMDVLDRRLEGKQGYDQRSVLVQVVYNKRPDQFAIVARFIAVAREHAVCATATNHAPCSIDHPTATKAVQSNSLSSSSRTVIGGRSTISNSFPSARPAFVAVGMD